MNKLTVALISLLLSTASFAQGKSDVAPGQEKAQGQSAKSYAPGQTKGSGQTAKPNAPGQVDKSQSNPSKNSKPKKN